MKTIPQLTDDISNYFKSRPEVAAVYLFGSYAAGRNRSNSDIDIAILLHPQNTLDTDKLHSLYLAKLPRLLRLDIDLIFMNTAGEGILKQIYRSGRCICNNNSVILSNFNMMTHSKIADFGYHYLNMQKRFVESITQESLLG
jgi:predicted nucleotidyltransferase